MMTPQYPLMAGIAGGLAIGFGLMAAGATLTLWIGRREWKSRWLSLAFKIGYPLFLVTIGLWVFHFIGPSVFLFLVPFLFFTLPMWVPRVAGGGLSLLTDSFTGGSEVEELRPFYARAVAYRKRGNTAAARTEIEGQLHRFPNDATGMMMLAELQADAEQDLPGALATLDELLEAPNRAPSEAALALQQKASWQLTRLQDNEGARASLQRIIDEFPGTEAAFTARQQVAHLFGKATEPTPEDPPRLVVVHHPERLGLIEAAPSAEAAEPDHEPETARLVAHLVEFPDDFAARERLAMLYGGRWNRPDLASDQWEQLIQRTTATPRQLAHWINQLADLQLRSPNGAGAARLTLERIMEKFPNSPWAEQAESRIRLLGLDQRAKAAPRTLRLGTYEKNLGLKRGDPTIPDPSETAV